MPAPKTSLVLSNRAAPEFSTVPMEKQEAIE